MHMIEWNTYRQQLATGVAAAMARMVGGGALVSGLIVLMLLFALVLSIITAMAGSSRTLYQGSVDGWLPRYLSHLNGHGVPTKFIQLRPSSRAGRPAPYVGVAAGP